MKSCLVLLTKKYPFETGEEFIENETPFLARRFDRVIVIATSVSDRTEQTRGVPENVEVHFLRASKIRNALLPAAALRAVLPLPGSVRGQDRAEAVQTFRRKLFCSYFLSKAEQVRRGCAQILREAGLDKSCSTTFYSYWFYDTALAAALLRREFGSQSSRAVSRAHRYDLYPEQNPSGFLPMREALLDGLDAVYPCSRDGSRSLERKYPGYAEKIRTAYLGTSDRGLSPKGTGGAFRLVSCCHISPVKRVGLLARSLAELKDSGISLQWTHFGGGDGLGALKDFAREQLSFMDCRFAGEVENAALMEFYRTTPVDCFLNTSSSEGLPVSIMEAVSFGIPVIATDVGGTSEIVHDGQTGFLLPADFQPQELARAVECLSHMPEEARDSLRTSCRGLWMEEFDSARNYARFADEIAPAGV